MTQPDAMLLYRSSWPASGLGEAMGKLVREAGLVTAPPEVDGPTSSSEGDIQTWMVDTGARLGVEIMSVSSTSGDLRDMLRRIGPSLLRLPGSDAARFLVVIGGGSFRLTVLTPEDGVRRLDPGLVFDGLMSDLLEAEEASVSALMNDLGLSAAIGGRGLRAFAMERLSEAPVLGIWFVRSSPGSAVSVQARTTHKPLLLALLLVARALSTGLLLILWWLIGRDVFGGNVSRFSLELWAMCLLSIVPLRLLDAWAQSRLTLDAGALLKQSLLYGVLHLDRATTRGRGAGQFLSMVMEGEVSSTAMESALLVLGALAEIVAALLVLSLGAGGDVHALLLLCWLAFTAWLCFRYADQAQRWMVTSREITHDLIERLVGYQTRLVQERADDRHQEEDTLLHGYLSTSQELDRRRLMLDGTVSTGWLILGIGALEPMLLSGLKLGSSMAVALGGVLMAGNALKQLVAGVIHLIEVWVSWQQTGPILQAGREALLRDAAGRGAPERRPRAKSGGAPLLRFDNLSLRYATNAPAALRGCSQQIRTGDRILLEGPSGGGKSTLAMVLSGMRAADAGAVRLFDERSEDMSPERFRAQVVLVPQFHDNHVLTESLLFNLLLGRRWPPTEADVNDAFSICDLLGLRPLLERMPQGLAQTVGDGGWALSHGERSRVFLARSLLQERVGLVILDESFAALDPETLRLSCRGVLASAPALLVIAHP